MPAYDERQSPPAPIAQAMLRSVETGEMVKNIPMLLDTGADLTLVPRIAVSQLGVSPISHEACEVTGFDGNRSVASVVVVDLILFGLAFRGRYLLSDDAIGIVGRNVLNHVTLEFNGPALEWNISN